MATEQKPRSQTSAPVKPPSSTRDPSAREDADEERAPARRAGEEEEVRGDRMPRGADEPGAGL